MPNTEVWKESRKRWKVKISGLIARVKAVPCMDCRGVFPSICMDFDHRPDEIKLFTISGCRGQHGEQRILNEIAKCDVVCANCHRLRTHGRTVVERVQNGYK